MNLQEFKEHFENAPEGKQFLYGISHPFSWRGDYSQVAFAITYGPMSREEILANIEEAYTNSFYGYKGGKYRYDDSTPINFEEKGYQNYSDGNYLMQKFLDIAFT